MHALHFADQMTYHFQTMAQWGKTAKYSSSLQTSLDDNMIINPFLDTTNEFPLKEPKLSRCVMV
jgi:hypothetical protein